MRILQQRGQKEKGGREVGGSVGITKVAAFGGMEAEKANGANSKT